MNTLPAYLAEEVTDVEIIWNSWRADGRCPVENDHKRPMDDSETLRQSINRLGETSQSDVNRSVRHVYLRKMFPIPVASYGIPLKDEGKIVLNNFVSPSVDLTVTPLSRPWACA